MRGLEGELVGFSEIWDGCVNLEDFRMIFGF